MRGLLLSPVVILGIALASARAQPGPEVPPASDPVVAPSPSPAVEPKPVDSPADDPIASPGNDPVAEPVATPPAAPADSVPRDHGTPAGVATDSAPAAPVAANVDSLAAARRSRAEEMRRRPPYGTGSDFRSPHHGVAPPAVAKSADEPLVPYEDERGDGRRLKSDPRASKLYRSPRKAFFYSLVLPGSGQAWCGAYVRAGLFAAAEVGLLYGWYDISIRQARAKTREAERFADTHWSASRYEATRKRLYDSSGIDNRGLVGNTMKYRKSYCEALYAFDNNTLRDACIDAPDSGANYANHVSQFADSGLSPDQVGARRRAGIKDLSAFYMRIGQNDEFVTGWADATSDTVSTAGLLAYEAALTDNDANTVPAAAPWGVSQMRAQYLGMRKDADKLAATQGWFLGGLVVNHILAAVDAALAAQRSNRRLYTEEKTSWVDGVHVQGGLAWSNGPATRADMFLEF